MNARYIFFNNTNRLRSGWRLAVFGSLFYMLLILLTGVLQVLLFASGSSFEKADELLAGNWGFVAQALLLFGSASLAGWVCGRLLERLPFAALGWALHHGWWRDLLKGALLGGASLLLATATATAAGGFNFQFTAPELFASVAKTLIISGLVFAIAAAAEEVLFRGYPLQTFLRALPVLIAVIPSSVLFAQVHMDNPNVVGGFTFVNTALAGVWLCVAYLRTRSLWFPLGLHWSWNWTMGALLGLPVSGITQLTPAPLFRATEVGPAWLTGGAYGIEGGAACTLALLLSTVFIWRTRLIGATEEMKRLTDNEVPASQKIEPSVAQMQLPKTEQPPVSNQS